MGTLAELWDAPTTEKKTTQDVAPKRNAFSTYVPGTQIGSEATSNLADLWEQTPAAEQPKEEQPNGMVADAIQKAFEARHKFNQTVAGVGEAGLTALTGSVAAPLAAATGLVYGARGGNPEEQARNLMQQMTYQPRTAKGQEYVQSLQNAFEASKLPPVFPEAQSLVGAQANRAAVKAAIPEVTIERQGVKPTVSSMQNAGAAATTNEASIKEAIAHASPEIQTEISKLPPHEVNLPVLQRHIEADSLPIPVRLTEGQATQDIHKISNEWNSRAKNQELANRFNEQNGQLIENLNAIRDQAAPNVYGTNHVENGEAIINSYKELDNHLKQGITEKYNALKEAAGGEFPVNGQEVANNAFANLRKELKTDFLSPAIAKQLESFKAGEPMTFEQFEAMRTNLAAEIRKAERTGDGNAAAAAGIVRQALEDLPLTGDAAELKPLADVARTAARERFDLLKKDKAFNAAVNDKVAADDFINKFVVNGKKADIDQMVQILGQDSTARETMAAGIVNWLKSKSGIVNESGNFSQAGYNKALAQVDPKLLAIVGPDVERQLKALGNVAKYTQIRPKGSYVNESNTFTAALGEKAKTGLEQAINLKTGGLGTMGRQFLQKRAAEKQIQESLKPAAGAKLSDIGKEQK